MHIYAILIFIIFSLVYGKETEAAEGMLDYSEFNWPTQCKYGKRQSPIDFASHNEFKYKKSLNHFSIVGNTYNAINNAHFELVGNHKYVLTLTDGGRLEVLKDGIMYSYILSEVHFHTKSEHTFSGQDTDVEFHLVHTKDKNFLTTSGVTLDPDGINQLLVVGILFQANGQTENADVNKMMFTNLTDVSNLNFNSYVTSKKSFYHYEGSRTSPPCEEAVQFIILSDIQKMTALQYRNIRQWIGSIYSYGNARMTQHLYNRSIYFYEGNAKHFRTSIISYGLIFIFLFFV